MQDEGDKHAHSSPIRTPRQLIVILALAFVVPIIGIILLTQFVTRSRQPDPETLAPAAVAARTQPVARVELAEAAAGPPPTTATAAAPAIATASPAAAPAATAAAESASLTAGTNPSELLQKYACFACHALDKKVVGPTYKEVAAKYAGDKDAAAELAHKVKSGGSGTWGQIPMPPNPRVPDDDLQTIIKYILAQK